MPKFENRMECHEPDDEGTGCYDVLPPVYRALAVCIQQLHGASLTASAAGLKGLSEDFRDLHKVLMDRASNFWSGPYFAHLREHGLCDEKGHTTPGTEPGMEHKRHIKSFSYPGTD
jgi:hypothetical protein